MPTHSWIGNAIEVLDNYNRAQDELHRMYSEAKVLGYAVRSITTANSVDWGYANWHLNNTVGVKVSYNGEWTLWWIDEVKFATLSDY
jgi:hypothetical protein